MIETNVATGTQKAFDGFVNFREVRICITQQIDLLAGKAGCPELAFPRPDIVYESTYLLPVTQASFSA